MALNETTQDAGIRSRSQIALLSATGQPVAQVASVTFFAANTALHRLDRYEQDGSDGLTDRPRAARPPKTLH